MAVEVVDRPDLQGPPLVLTGPEALSFPEIARRLSTAGREVRYRDVSPRQLRAELLAGGLPLPVAENILEIQALAVAVPERPTDTVSSILGRSARSFEEFVREHAMVFASNAYGRLLATRF